MLKRLLARFARTAPDDTPALPPIAADAAADNEPDRATVTVGGVVYPYPWRPLPDGGYEDRLGFEVTKRHPLFGKNLKVIGQSEASDDIAIALEDGRFAIVHLTWSSDPGDKWYPSTAFYASEAELSQAFRWWADDENEPA